MKYYCRNKENCMNKEICLDCLVKINNDLPFSFDDEKGLNYFLNENKCIVVDKYENKNNAKFIIFTFKEFKFAFYECQECFKWYRVLDHPFRLSENIKNNQNLSPTCSRECGYKHRDNSIYKTNGFRTKMCNKCNEETLHNGNVCCICNPKAKTHNSTDYKKIISNNIKPGKCTVCGIFNKKRSVAGLGESECNCALKQRKSMSNFNRENFYSDKFNIIEFDNLNRNVTLEDFDSLNNKIGVWSRWTDLNHGNYCLDVCKTINIGQEMLSSLRSFDSLIQDPDQELDITWKQKYKKQLIDAGSYDKNNVGKIVFKLVAICQDEKEALKIEAQYAHDNKAKYWNPEPGQTILLNPNI